MEIQTDAAIRRPAFVLTAIVAVVLSFGLALFTHVEPAEAGMLTGTYNYTYGHPELWGTGQGPQSGYTLDCSISKVSGPYAKLKINKSYFYGDTGFYSADQAVAKIVKFKNRRASFTFRTACGDICKAKIILISKSKMKLAVKTTQYGRERMPLTTDYKYKLLRWETSAIYHP